ncbi:MAG TPA: hypothetical protein VN939_12155, partial [Chthoniobacterales bacterium]|nr:hypothetical protein [Chthoniobacterales bacterium]
MFVISGVSGGRQAAAGYFYRPRSPKDPRADRKPTALEGSRFARWQLYGLAAGGSRERLEVWQFYGPVYPSHG